MILPQDEPEIPNAIQELIDGIKSEPVRNPPSKVFRYTYQEDTVYYIPGFCCDQMSAIYSKNGELVCRPDGGFTGNGDGRCNDFFESRADDKIVWSDPR